MEAWKLEGNDCKSLICCWLFKSNAERHAFHIFKFLSFRFPASKPPSLPAEAFHASYKFPPHRLHNQRQRRNDNG